MTDIDFNQAVEDFWQASQGGAFPVQWQDSFDRETAYRICLAMIARRAARGARRTAIRKPAGRGG